MKRIFNNYFIFVSLCVLFRSALSQRTAVCVFDGTIYDVSSLIYGAVTLTEVGEVSSFDK